MNNSAGTQQLDKSDDRVREMFSQIAPRYDMMNHLLSLGIDSSWRRQVVRRLRLDQSLPVLDCCTGTGDLALMLARRVQGKVQVVGTDFCEPMLDRARNKLLHQLPDYPVRFQQADTQALPFEDGFFQAVTVAFGLRNVQDTDKGLQEMSRVCTPGGQVCVLEFSQPTLPGLRQLYQVYFQHVLPRIGQYLARNSQAAYEYLPESVSQFPSGEQLVERMRATGLKDIQIKPLTFGVATIYLGTR